MIPRSLRTIPVVAAAALLGGAAAAGAVSTAGPGATSAAPSNGASAAASVVPQSGDIRNLDVARDVLASKVGTSLGPPGGEVRALVKAAGDPQRLYLGTVDGHLYYSNDGAASWTRSPTPLPADAVVDNIAVHPANDDLVYAAYYQGRGTGGLIRSSDGGRSWVELFLLGNPSLRALAIAPSNPEVIYAGGLGGVWKTINGGRTWTDVGDDRKPFQFVESLAVDPRDPDRVYAGTWRQAYRTLDGGESWHRIHNGMAIDRDVFSVTIDPRNPDALLAGTCNFIYVSGTGGDAWSERREGLADDHNRVHLVAHDPSDPDVLYAGTRGALYRSDDAGASWGIALAGVSVSAIQVAPSGYPVYIGTEERGVLVSDDGRVFQERNLGLYASRVVAFDALPGAPRVLFAARSEGPTQDTVHYSTNVGSTWSELGFAPPLGRVDLIRAQLAPINRVLIIAERGWWSVRPGGRWVAVDPAPGSLHAMEIAHDVDGQVLAATTSGLYVATAADLGTTDPTSQPFTGDASATWRPLWEGGPITSLSIEGDRFLGVGPDRTVAGTLVSGAGGNGGRSDAEIRAFEAVGLPESVVAVALARDDAQLAYAAAGHSVFRTANGGASWQELPLPWPAADLRAIAIDPSHADQVLALDFGGALYRGHDGGRHWLILDSDPGLARAWKLRVSPQAPGLALIATHGQGLRVVALDPLEQSTQ